MDLKPLEVYRGKTDYMLVYSNAGQIEKLKPDMSEDFGSRCPDDPSDRSGG